MDELYIEYKQIPHYYEDEYDVRVAKNLFGTQRLYFFNTYQYDIFSDEEQQVFADREKANIVTDEKLLNKFNEYISKYKQALQLSPQQLKRLHNTLSTLKFIENREYSKFYYSTLGNEININPNLTNHDIENTVLAHEIGHILFNNIEINKANTQLTIKSGVYESAYSINVTKVDDNNIYPTSYTFVELKESMHRKYEGLEEMLNDSFSQKICEKVNKLYPSFGEIIENLIGLDVCLLARKNNDATIINNEMLKIIPSEEKLNELYKTFDEFLTRDKTKKTEAELKGYTLLGNYVKQHLQNTGNNSALFNWNIVSPENQQAILNLQQECKSVLQQNELQLTKTTK